MQHQVADGVKPDVNENLFCVYGLRRSGNHAVIAWIMDSLPGRPQVHLNNIHLLNPHPYRSFTSLRIRGIDRYTCRRKRYGINRFVLTRIAGPLVPTDWRQHVDSSLAARISSLDVEAIRRARKRVLVLSYEDIDLENPRLHKFLDTADGKVGSSGAMSQVLILRDPYNLFASLKKKGYMTATSGAFYVRLWKQHARRFQSGRDATGRSLVPVNFNTWISDPAYRIKTGRQLGFETDGVAYMDVPDYGGGSSFEGKADSAESLSTDERWESFVDDADYRSLFDGDVRAMAREIFAMDPPF
jgi:hypothetical protein